MKDELKEIEIPFGAKDSELCGWEYTIPEGMEATIVDNKIIVKKKESEDEKIRKELLEHCKNQAKPYIQTGNKCPQIQSWISWLEKKGEQNLAWSEEDEKTIDEAVECLENYVEYVQGGFSKQHVLDLASRVESLKDRYFWKPSEEQMDALNLAIGEANSVDTAAGDEAAEILTSLYEQLKKLREG